MSKERLFLFDTTMRDGAQTQINPFAGMQTDKLIARRNSLSAAGGEV